MIAVDTNVLVALSRPGEETARAAAVFEKDPAWVAPLLWRSEMRSALLTMIRADRLDLSEALAVAELAADLLASEHEIPNDEALALAIDSGCSAYDCEFVALASALGIRLVTLDRRLERAFPDVAISPEAFTA